MADTKVVEVEEVPTSDLSRIFNRVDVVKATPTEIYGDKVELADMAIFSISPADPVVRDKLKQVLLGFSIFQNDICTTNGIPLSALSEPLKKPAKNSTKKKNAEYLAQLEAVGLALTQIKQATNYEMTKESTRELIAKCVKVDNFKEYATVDSKDVLVDSKKSNTEIMASIPDVFIVWLFDKVQHISNLTADEVLGL